MAIFSRKKVERETNFVRQNVENVDEKSSNRRRRPGVRIINVFTTVIYECLFWGAVFTPGKPIKPSLMFESKAVAYPSEVLLGTPL